jgi:hypothetical protein
MPTAAVRDRALRRLVPFFVARYLLRQSLLRAGNKVACQFELTALRHRVPISGNRPQESSK